MSVGFFLGVANSYPPELAVEAASFVDSINAVLTSNGFAAYHDATPDLSALGMGRCSLDHLGSGGLARFLSFARQHDLHVAFEASGARDVFLPIRFDVPLKIPVGKFLGFTRYAKVGSLHAMVDALHQLAPLLDIPIDNSNVDDSIAALIDKMEPLFDGDDDDATMLEDLRMAWLLYHEAANLAIQHNVALALGA